MYRESGADANAGCLAQLFAGKSPRRFDVALRGGYAARRPEGRAVTPDGSRLANAMALGKADFDGL